MKSLNCSQVTCANDHYFSFGRKVWGQFPHIKNIKNIEKIILCWTRSSIPGQCNTVSQQSCRTVTETVTESECSSTAAQSSCETTYQEICDTIFEEQCNFVNEQECQVNNLAPTRKAVIVFFALFPLPTHSQFLVGAFVLEVIIPCYYRWKCHV